MGSCPRLIEVRLEKKRELASILDRFVRSRRPQKLIDRVENMEDLFQLSVQSTVLTDVLEECTYLCLVVVGLWRIPGNIYWLAVKEIRHEDEVVGVARRGEDVCSLEGLREISEDYRRIIIQN